MPQITTTITMFNTTNIANRLCLLSCSLITASDPGVVARTSGSLRGRPLRLQMSCGIDDGLDGAFRTGTTRVYDQVIVFGGFPVQTIVPLDIELPQCVHFLDLLPGFLATDAVLIRHPFATEFQGRNDSNVKGFRPIGQNGLATASQDNDLTFLCQAYYGLTGETDISIFVKGGQL